jgi:cell division septation protein DedD
MADAGLEVPHGDGVLPSEERLNGKHISDKIAGDVSAVKSAIDGGEKPKEAAPKKQPAVTKASKAAEKKPAAKDDKPAAKKPAAKPAEKNDAKPAAKKKVKEAE